MQRNAIMIGVLCGLLVSFLQGQGQPATGGGQPEGGVTKPATTQTPRNADHGEDGRDQLKDATRRGGRRSRREAQQQPDNVGTWVYGLDTQELRFLLDWPNPYAISADLKHMAKVGASKAEREKLTEREKQTRVADIEASIRANLSVRITRLKDEKDIALFEDFWEEKKKGGKTGLTKQFHLEWSPDGRKVLAYDNHCLAVFGVDGKTKMFKYRQTMLRDHKPGAKPPPPPETYLSGRYATWCGKRGNLVAAARCYEKADRRPEVVCVNVNTGAVQKLCSFPPEWRVMFTRFLVSEDGGTVAFMDDSELWLWRRGMRSPERLAVGKCSEAAMSADGKHLVVRIRPVGKLFSRMWDLATGRVLWEVPARSAYGPFVFDHAGKRLLVAAHGSLLLTSPDTFRPDQILVAKAGYRIVYAAWSSDERSVILRIRLIPGRVIPVVIPTP
jgi:hypothetical protein